VIASASGDRSLGLAAGGEQDVTLVALTGSHAASGHVVPMLRS
jgi:hypothetical protein